MFKVNNRNTRTRCEICSKLAVKPPKRRQWRRRRSGVFIVNFEHISNLVLVLLLLTLRKKCSHSNWENNLTKLKYPHPFTKYKRRSIKVPLIFWFLIMTFNSCFFYHQLWVKWVRIHIGNSSGHVGQIHSWFLKCLWMFDTARNARRTGILDNLFDSWQPHQYINSAFTWSKTELCIVNLTILCTSTKTSIHWKFKDKLLNLF